MEAKTIKKNIFTILKDLYDNLKNEYYLVKKEYLDDKYNYNKIVKYKEKKNYIKKLLSVDKINDHYFFKNNILVPTEEELGNIDLLIDKLWSIDSNRFIINKDFRLNLQTRIEKDTLKDDAPYPLFDYVNTKKFKLPTYNHLLKIHKFFSKEIGVTENDTEYKQRQIITFIRKMCDTNIFIYLFYFLHAKGVVKHFLDFPEYIYKLWFNHFTKKNTNDSSPFEHVFMGEISDGKILGFHNWIQFFIEERIGKVNYYGYINQINEQFPYIIEIRFSWENNIKRTSTFFIGTSPEFEFAIYTMCFHLTDDGKNNVVFTLNNSKIQIMVIKKNDLLIASYPKII